jgi:hypothetical protein
VQQHRPRVGALDGALTDASEAAGNRGFGLVVLLARPPEGRVVVIGCAGITVAIRFRRLVALGIAVAKLQLARRRAGTSAPERPSSLSA